MRLLVAGSRKYTNRIWLGSSLDTIFKNHHISVLIHGGSGRLNRDGTVECGADLLAGEWARQNGIPEEIYPVSREEWSRHGKAAGPMRNQRMLDQGKPDAAAFMIGGNGTRDMVNRVAKAGIRILYSDMPVF